MKPNFMQTCYNQFVTPETREFIRLNVSVANRIYDILEERGMSQKDFAKLMGKTEAEVSRWLSGTHNFTMETIARINYALGENVLEVPQKPMFIFVRLDRSKQSMLPINKKESNRQYNPSNSYEISR